MTTINSLSDDDVFIEKVVIKKKNRKKNKYLEDLDNYIKQEKTTSSARKRKNGKRKKNREENTDDEVIEATTRNSTKSRNQKKNKDTEESTDDEVIEATTRNSSKSKNQKKNKDTEESTDDSIVEAATRSVSKRKSQRKNYRDESTDDDMRNATTKNAMRRKNRKKIKDSEESTDDGIVEATTRSASKRKRRRKNYRDESTDDDMRNATTENATRRKNRKKIEDSEESTDDDITEKRSSNSTNRKNKQKNKDSEEDTDDYIMKVTTRSTTKRKNRKEIEDSEESTDSDVFESTTRNSSKRKKNNNSEKRTDDEITEETTSDSTKRKNGKENKDSEEDTDDDIIQATTSKAMKRKARNKNNDIEDAEDDNEEEESSASEGSSAFDIDSDELDDGKVNKRRPYTLEEDMKIINYLSQDYYYMETTGLYVFQKMERKNVCRGRSTESMRNRFHKYIVPNLHLEKYKLDEETIKKLKRDVDPFIRTEGGTRISKHPRHQFAEKYAKEEDLKLIEFICQDDNYKKAGGCKIWKVAVKKNVLPCRTYIGIKNRFFRLLPRIKDYNIPEEWKNKLMGINDSSLREDNWKVKAKFSKKEDRALIDYATSKSRYFFLDSIKLWRLAENQGICPGKSCRQMCFRMRHIIKTKNLLNSFKLNEKQEEKLLYTTRAPRSEVLKKRKIFLKLKPNIFNKEHRCIHCTEIDCGRKKGRKLSSKEILAGGEGSSISEKLVPIKTEKLSPSCSPRLSMSSKDSSNQSNEEESTSEDELEEQNVLFNGRSSARNMRSRLKPSLESRRQTSENVVQNGESSNSVLKEKSPPEKPKGSTKRKREDRSSEGDGDDQSVKKLSTENATLKKKAEIENTISPIRKERIIQNGPKKVFRNPFDDKLVSPVAKTKRKKNNRKIDLNFSKNGISVKEVLNKLRRVR